MQATPILNTCTLLHVVAFLNAGNPKGQSNSNYNLPLWKIMEKQIFKINKTSSIRTSDNQKNYWTTRAYNQLQPPSSNYQSYASAVTTKVCSITIHLLTHNSFSCSKPNK